MGSSGNEQEVYAAASLREHLREIDLSEASEAFPHAGLVQDERRLKILNQLAVACEGDVQDEQAWVDLVRPAGTETITDAVGSGNVSQMQYAVGMVDHSKDGDGAKTKVARMLAREGNIGLVLGPPGSGKTAVAIDAARVWKAVTGGTIVSNIDSWDGTDEYVETDQEMLSAMQAVEGQVLGIIDEGAQNLTSRGDDQAATNLLAKRLKLVRKKEDGDRFAKRGSILGIFHTRKDTAAELRRLANFAVEKPSRENPSKMRLYDSEGGRDKLEEVAEYKGVTDTTEVYREHEASEFDVEMDDGDDGEQVDAGDVRRDVDVQTVIKARMRGQTEQEAAALTDGEFSGSWAGDRWREWLRGEHRELVPMPDDPPETVVKALERIE